jgi:hypothetical protein
VNSKIYIIIGGANQGVYMMPVLPTIKTYYKDSQVIHTCNLSTWVAEAGGSQVQGQPRLHTENLSKNKQKPLNMWGWGDREKEELLEENELLKFSIERCFKS